jgi:hypothetical protein
MRIRISEGTTVTWTPTRDEFNTKVSEPTELLIREAHQKALRRRLRVGAITLITISVITLATAYGFDATRASLTARVARDADSSPRTIAPCTTSNLRLTDYGTDVHAGSWDTLWQLTNVGAHACSMVGYPKVALMTSQGLSRSLVSYRFKDQVDPKFGDLKGGLLPTTVLASNSAGASFWIAGADTPSRSDPVVLTATEVLVTPPGAKEALAYRTSEDATFVWSQNAIDLFPILPGASGDLPAEPLNSYGLERAN